MTMVNKKINKVKTVEKKFSYKGFSLGNTEREKSLKADYAAAVKVEGGKLKRTFLWELFPVHGSYAKLFDTEKGIRRAMETFDYSSGGTKRRFLYVAGSGETYSYSENDKGFVLDGLRFSDTPMILSAFTLDGLENLLFFSSDGVYFYDNATRESVQVLEKGSTMACLVEDRAFTAVGTRVYYCAPLAFDDWSETQNGGGFMDFSSDRGEIIALAEVDGKLGVFFKRGVSLLSVRSGAKEFERTDLAFPFGEILKGSVATSGKTTVFLTKDAAFCFDGERFDEIYQSDTLGEMATEQNCESLTFAGEAYLLYSITGGKKRMLVYGGESKEGYFVENPSVGGMTASKDKLFNSMGGKIYSLVEKGNVEFSSTYGFYVKKKDFSFDGEKTLKSLKLKGSGMVRIAVSSERGGHVYTVALKKDGSMVCPLLKGRAFDMNIIPQVGSEISGLDAVVVFAGR